MTCVFIEQPCYVSLLTVCSIENHCVVEQQLSIGFELFVTSVFPFIHFLLYGRDVNCWVHQLGVCCLPLFIKIDCPLLHAGDDEPQVWTHLLLVCVFLLDAPASWALPVTTAVSKPVLIRQTLGMIHTKTQVTYQHLSRQMAFKTIPVMIFCFPVLQKIQNNFVWHFVNICND